VKLALLLLCVALTGCASVEGLSNRVSCTPSGDVAFVNSMYWQFGITSILHPDDALAICVAPPIRN
jgi:hypothetical protein